MCYWVTMMVFALLVSGCAVSSPVSAPITDSAARGAQLFTQGRGDAPPCSACHQTASGQFGFSFGPNLAGIGERARTRMDGLTVEEYLHQSILEPGRYIVSGYRNMMYSDFKSHLTEQDVQDLIAYLLTL